MASGGGDGQPHLRVTSSNNSNNNARRLREDLQTVVRSSLSPLMEVNINLCIYCLLLIMMMQGGAGTSSPSSLAAHLSHLLPPPAPGHGSTVQTSPTTWQDNITVTVQPQLLNSSPRSSALSPSHVLDIEVFQTQQQQQQQQQTGATDNNNSNQQPNLEADNGWSALLNSNPELKAVVTACEKYIPFLLIVMVKSVFEHGTGIIVCLGLVLTFLHANSVLKQQVVFFLKIFLE